MVMDIIHCVFAVGGRARDGIGRRAFRFGFQQATAHDVLFKEYLGENGNEGEVEKKSCRR